MYLLYIITRGHVYCFLVCIIPECRFMCICCSLSSNNISDEGARAIADGMKYCTSLERLE